MEEIWFMDKRELLLKKDCIFITNQYIILYIGWLLNMSTLFSNKLSFILIER